MILKLKSRSGEIMDLQCQALLEVDGKPFTQADDQFAERFAYLEARVSALYELFTRQEDETEIPIPESAGDSVIAVSSTGG